jgi:hypothetical protein
MLQTSSLPIFTEWRFVVYPQQAASKDGGSCTPKYSTVHNRDLSAPKNFLYAAHVHLKTKGSYMDGWETRLLTNICRRNHAIVSSPTLFQSTCPWIYWLYLGQHLNVFRILSCVDTKTSILRPPLVQ